MTNTSDRNEHESSDKQVEEASSAEETQKRKHHIKPTLLRRTLKCLLGLVVFVLMLPVMVYIPPVQTLLKNAARSYLAHSTGMTIDIERFRLRAPIDVSLDGVTVVEATGDTMVRAHTLEADIKLLPLLKLDVQIKKLRFTDGYYRILSTDSSMMLKVYAPYFEASTGTSANIARSLINLDEVTLRGGKLNLQMDVWKAKPTPPTPGLFVINAKKVHLQDFTFTMSMLPTIDSLGLTAKNIELEAGLVDLKKNIIDIGKAKIADGSATYIVPTAEYVKTHPAPPPSPYPSKPMTVRAKSLALTGFNALYATKNVRPQPGFDAAYMQFHDLALEMQDFYNEQSTLRLPITRLEGHERSGLTITSGVGTVALDSAGIALRQLHLTTTASDISVDAYVSMGAMALQPDAPFSLKGDMTVGLSDIQTFMPSLRPLLQPLKRFGPLQADIDASGTMRAIAVPKINLRLPGCLVLQAKGRVANAMNINRIDANLELFGNLMAPHPLQAILQFDTFKLPPLTIRGKAEAKGKNYAANFTLTSPAGDIKADGKIGLNSERYYANVDMRNLDVSLFAPDAGIGLVSGHLNATGAGFNPSTPRAEAEIALSIDRVEYNNYPLTDISAHASLHSGIYSLDLTGDNAALTGFVSATGNINKGVYNIDMTADVANLDMHLLGLSTDTCEARGTFSLVGNINPDNMLGELHLTGNDLYYRSGSVIYNLPGAVDADMLSQTDTIHAFVDAQKLRLDFGAPYGLKYLMPQMSKAMSMITQQVIITRRLDMEKLQDVLPDFDLDLNANGSGILSQILSPMDMKVDSISASIHNHKLLIADARALKFSTPTITLDTITANLNERGQLLDYALHLGNAAGPMEEFADVNLTGYIGLERMSAFLRQRNIKGETGYRLGLTAFFSDSLMNIHFTPLKATIAYLPWRFNDDNFISYDMKNRIDANLSAQSNESSISLRTIEEPGMPLPPLHVNLQNIHLQDFAAMIIGAPDVGGTLNAEMKLWYLNKVFTGQGKLGLKDFAYEGRRVADFDGNFDAGLDLNGNTSAHATLDIDGHRALAFNGTLSQTEQGLQPADMTLEMDDFPVSVANAFLPADMAQVSGNLTGAMSMSGNMSSPILNGTIRCSNVKVMIPMMAGTLSLDTMPLTVANNKITFDNFDIYGAKNALTLNGSVDATNINKTTLDLALSGKDFVLIDNDKRARSQIYGKVILNTNATVKGPLNLLDVNGTLSVLRGTNVFYTLSDMQQLSQTDKSDVVKFVLFSDTTLSAQTDSLTRSSYMRIKANLTIANGVQATLNLNNKGTDCVQISPTGTLSYFQSYLGDTRLNGQINLGSGFARYAIPALGEKRFDLASDSYVIFNGDIANPTLHLSATDKVKSVANTGGNSSRVLTFLVTVSATGTLSRPNVLFDLSTNDDVSIQNELQSMSADQRSTEAMNMILYGRYMGPGAVSNTSGAQGIATNALYGFLESQLNNWTANNIRGVELSFGIEQFNTQNNGNKGTSTSYSYQVSKSLFNDKFKIVVGGYYSTDQNAEQDIAENLISNISFEYMLRQTNSTSMYAKLFRRSNYESILEGEITEMGAGIVLQRKISTLKQIFTWLRRLRRQHKKQGTADPPTPTTTQTRQQYPEPTDSLRQK